MRSWQIGRTVILLLVVSFGVLLFSGARIYQDKPPIPARVVASDGTVLATFESIQGGQSVYLEHQLADFGTFLGHGSYYGPDFTALAVHELEGVYSNALPGREAVVAAFKTNTYDAASDTLPLTDVQAAGLLHLEQFVRDQALAVWPGQGVHLAVTPEETRALSHYFWWSAWVSTTNRPGLNYTYTNNWPYDARVGNQVSADSVLWSGISVALLIAGVGFITALYFWGGYHGEDTGEPALPIHDLDPTPSQRKLVKYLAVAVALFAAQVFLGGYMAHAYIEPGGFYGIDLSRLLPFNVARGWHLQLAIFWIAASFLAMGLYLAPLIGGREPRHQGLLVDLLFGAVVLVVVGSMAGEYLSVAGLMPDRLHLFGSAGWEYLELGYAWRMLLFVGLCIWAGLVLRAVWPALRAEANRWGMAHLFSYATAGVALVYAAALLFDRGTHISLAEYWRWWVIHLWVEGMFEVFAVTVMGVVFWKMGLVDPRSTSRAIQFQLAILLGSGVIGTGHHLYFTGSPALLIGLSACFSAFEVIPLCLLCIEALGQYRTLQEQGREFPHKPVFWFLLCVAFWNLFGAGGLGFLINLPMVSYFEMGTWFTAAHAHGALMGVYGMLSIAMMMFVLRGTLNGDYWERNGRLVSFSFIALNAGLLAMVLGVLIPVGYLQLQQSVDGGFWSARTLAFYEQPVVHAILWLRIVPDAVFIAGVLALAAFVGGGLLHVKARSSQVLDVRAGGEDSERPRGERRKPGDWGLPHPA